MEFETLTPEEKKLLYSFLTGFLVSAPPEEPLAQTFRKLHTLLNAHLEQEFTPREYKQLVDDTAKEIELAQNAKPDFEPGLKAMKEAYNKNFPFEIWEHEG